MGARHRGEKRPFYDYLETQKHSFFPRRLNAGWPPALPLGKEELGDLAFWDLNPGQKGGQPMSPRNCRDGSVPLGNQRGHSLVHLQGLAPGAFIQHWGERLQDEATSTPRFSPSAPSKQPQLASCPKLSPPGAGREQPAPVLLCWPSLRD